MTAHRLDVLIRQIDPSTFDPSVHGNGHRFVHSSQDTRPFKPSLWSSLFGKRDERHYFVKHWLTPKEVDGWTFHWSEGTSAISLDFGSQFVIQANGEGEALRLVRTLAERDQPGENLHALIDASLHRELETLLRDCERKGSSLLDCFRRSSAGIGESEDLNQKVSQRVTDQLGGAYFRIGLQLKNAPPSQIKIHQKDAFTLADSRREHCAETTALLQLSNYQAYKKSGLDSVEAIQQTIGRSITQAVNQLLFARKYYDVVQSFKRDQGSVENQIKARIIEQAATIGYSVEMFQSYPDMTAVKLLDPTRIDIPAADEKYYLANSASYVQVGVALSVRVERDCSRLHLIINPNEEDAFQPIMARVKRICRDTIQRFDREKFNLHFKAIVEPDLNKAIVAGLNEYGLETKIIHLHQEPTEDARRYMALRGRTIGFRADISPHANAGDADVVSIAGKIEVISISQTGWERFESKDFGFRDDSRMPESWQRQQAQLNGLTMPETVPFSALERQSLAIDLELAEIRDRVVSALMESMSKVPDLASNWRTVESSRQIIEWAQKLGAQAIEDEFGLTIALRGVRRGDTETEGTTRVRHTKTHDLARQLLDQDVQHQLKLRRVTDEDVVKEREIAGSKRQLALEEEDHEQHGQALEEVQSRLNRDAKVPRLTLDSAAKVLEPHPPERREELPWLKTDNSRGKSPDGRGSG